jgi:hypothetical protein
MSRPAPAPAPAAAALTSAFAAVCGSSLLLAPAPVRAVTCDGTELLCIDGTSESEVLAAGGTVVGGSFSAAGFMPSQQGGLLFEFGSSFDLSTGGIEFDIEGLLPVEAGELDGGKVSPFSLCGLEPQANEAIDFQKMDPEYRDGHVFRYGQDDDGLADNWDYVIITSSEFGCAYSIDNPPWTVDQTHHIAATWSPVDGLTLLIDGVPPCTNNGWGNGDAFDPAEAMLVIGNRCTWYPNQQPVAWIRNIRFWGAESELEPPTPPGDPCPGEPRITAGELDPDSGSGAAQLFHAHYAHCEGGEAFRIVQLTVADEVDGVAPAVPVAWEDGRFWLGDASCAPGDPVELINEYGALNCAASLTYVEGDDRVVDWQIRFDFATFGGTHGLWFDAKGGTGEEEPRLGWTPVGTWTVTQGEGGGDDDGPGEGDDDEAGDEDDGEGDADGDGSGGAGGEAPGGGGGQYSCACGRIGGGGETGGAASFGASGLLLLYGASRRARRTMIRA